MNCLKMEKVFRLIALGAALCCFAGCNNKDYKMGTYGYDVAYFAKHGIGIVELVDGQSKVMVIPAWQGRIQTSTTDGNEGTSYGWTNYRFIDAGKVSPQFNPFGGEERFWIGPEGGPFSWYFRKGDEQVYENWKVPSYIDTDAYDVVEQTPAKVVLAKEFDAVNASDNAFRIGVTRTVSLVGADELKGLLGVDIQKLKAFLPILGNRFKEFTPAVGQTTQEDDAYYHPICAIAITVQEATESLQELNRVFPLSSRPVIKQDNRGLSVIPRKVNPHIGFRGRLLPRFPEYLAWDFIGMQDFPQDQAFMKTVINRQQVLQGTLVIPVCYGFPRQPDSLLFPVFFLPVKGEEEPGFIIHDCCYD